MATDSALLSNGTQTYDADVATFGERLKELRGEISQEKLGAKLGHKRASTVAGWEGGKMPKPEKVRSVAKALGVEPRALLEGVITAYDRLRGPAMLRLIAYASLLPDAEQEEMAEMARERADDAGRQWRDVPTAARKRGTPAKAHTNR